MTLEQFRYQIHLFKGTTPKFLAQQGLEKNVTVGP